MSVELQKVRADAPDNMGPKEKKVYTNCLRTHHEFENDCLSRIFYVAQLQKWDNL
jgi:hypothetical protein